MAHAHITARFCPRDMRPPAVPSPKEGRNGHSSQRYPGRYDVLDFYGRKVAEEFAAWNPEPDSYTRHTFQHRMGDALIELEAQPQAAVASHTDFLFGLCRKGGNDGFACNKHPGFRRGRRYFVPLLTAHTAIKFFDLA